VNSTLDPKLKKQLMNRQLFQFTCPKCGTAIDCIHDTLYHDQEKKVMIWLKHPEENGVMSMHNLPLNIAERLLSTYHLRLVTSYGSLLEKIHCFDNDLDDRVIELLKTTVYQHLFGAELDHDASFFFAGLRKQFLRKMEMDFVSVNSACEQWYHIPFSPIYDQVSNKFRESCKDSTPKGEWLLVNQKYLDILFDA